MHYTSATSIIIINCIYLFAQCWDLVLQLMWACTCKWKYVTENILDSMLLSVNHLSFYFVVHDELSEPSKLKFCHMLTPYWMQLILMQIWRNKKLVKLFLLWLHTPLSINKNLWIFEKKISSNVPENIAFNKCQILNTAYAFPAILHKLW